MRFSIAMSLIALPALLFAQEADQPSVKALVDSLGSASFQVRQAATKALKDRPESAPALRDALRSPDSEIRKRAAEVLEHFERQPIRDLNAAIKDGRASDVIATLAAWPAGKYEEDAWSALRKMAHDLADRHEKKGGSKIHVLEGWDRILTEEIIRESRVTESTRAQPERRYFIRAKEVDVDWRRRKVGDPPNLVFCTNVIVAERSVRVIHVDAHIILAGANVELDGVDERRLAVIVSGGDVSVKGNLQGALVIARGKISCSDGNVKRSRFISGKSVTITSNQNANLITENEPNPLGFIRWADAPKDKAEPKKK